MEISAIYKATMDRIITNLNQSLPEIVNGISGRGEKAAKSLASAPSTNRVQRIKYASSTNRLPEKVDSPQYGPPCKYKMGVGFYA